jgi:hypothetical protein
MELLPPSSTPFSAASSPRDPQYAFCHTRFFGLSLIEYAGLSFLAYLKPNSPGVYMFIYHIILLMPFPPFLLQIPTYTHTHTYTAFDAFFGAAFDMKEWQLMHFSQPRSQGAVFVDLYNSRLNTSVVSIRGTNPKNLFDVFQDMVNIK